MDLLVQLRDLAGHRGTEADYRGRVEELRARYARRPSLMSRLQKAGLGG